MSGWSAPCRPGRRLASRAGPAAAAVNTEPRGRFTQQVGPGRRGGPSCQPCATRGGPQPTAGARPRSRGILWSRGGGFWQQMGQFASVQFGPRRQIRAEGVWPSDRETLPFCYTRLFPSPGPVENLLDPVLPFIEAFLQQKKADSHMALTEVVGEQTPEARPAAPSSLGGDADCPLSAVNGAYSWLDREVVKCLEIKVGYPKVPNIRHACAHAHTPRKWTF